MRQTYDTEDIKRIAVKKAKDSKELAELLSRVDLNAPSDELLEALDLERVEAYQRKPE